MFLRGRFGFRFVLFVGGDGSNILGLATAILVVAGGLGLVLLVDGDAVQVVLLARALVVVARLAGFASPAFNFTTKRPR